MDYKGLGKIVLLEDTTILKMRLEKLLKSVGFSEVLSFSVRGKTFESLMGKINTVDAIIVDLDQYEDMFNDIDLKNDILERNQNLKIIVLVKEIDSDRILGLYNRGVHEVLLKPFSDDGLMEKLVGISYKQDLYNDKATETIKNDQITNDIKPNLKGGKSMLKWCEEYEIGIKIIDDEHKDIIDHFEKLYSSMKEGHGKDYYNELVSFLKQYVDVHFENEEKFQLEIKYSNFDEHREIHRKFKEDVNKLIEKTNPDLISDKELLDLNMFVKNWLMNHILNEDKKIGKYYNDNMNN